jgi:hypothetical protein
VLDEGVLDEGVLDEGVLDEGVLDEDWFIGSPGSWDAPQKSNIA